jgi:thiol-disulfide isomerase/thioredoxin
LRIITLSGALLLSACGAAHSSLQTTSPAPSKETVFKAHRVWNLQGQQVQLLKQASGRVAVIDLWATWCTGCEKAHQNLEQLAARYPREALFVAGVNVGQALPEVLEYLRHHKYGYAVYLDPQFQFAEALDISEIPAIFILDKSGAVLLQTRKLDDAALSLIAEATADSTKPDPQKAHSQAEPGARPQSPALGM